MMPGRPSSARRRGRVLWCTLALWLAGLVLGALPAAASYRINDYQVRVDIRPDSVLEFTETLVVNLDVPRHGIFRKIPVSYRVKSMAGPQPRRATLGSRRYTVDIYDVTTPGHQNKTYRQGDYLVIRIGDPDRYLRGRQRFVIRYKIYGGINFFDDHAEFYWNLIGHQWHTIIDRASFAVALPRSLELLPNDVFVYTGPVGARGRAVVYRLGRHGISGHTTAALPPGHGVTLGLRLPAGYLTRGGLWLRVRLFFTNSPLLLVPILALLILLPLWWFRGRDPKPTIMARFHPPKDMTPPEMAYLVNESGRRDDLVSLLPYWGAAGCLRIEVLPPGDQDAERDYRFTKLANLPAGSRPFEHTIFNQMFVDGDQVRLSQLQGRLGQSMLNAQEMLEALVNSRGWFTKGSRGLAMVLTSLGVVALLAALLWAVLAWLEVEDMFNWPNTIALAATGGLMVFFGHIMPQKQKAGARRYAEAMGFREFVKRAEQGKLKMLLAEDPDYFDRTLAYAMALGLAEGWGRTFEGLLSQPPQWYVAPSLTSGLWTMSYLTSGLNHMGSAVGGVFKQPPPQSGTGFSSGTGFGGGGFGGGGFGGGGGGGGGGGTW